MNNQTFYPTKGATYEVEESGAYRFGDRIMTTNSGYLASYSVGTILICLSVTEKKAFFKEPHAKYGHYFPTKNYQNSLKLIGNPTTQQKLFES